VNSALRNVRKGLKSGAELVAVALFIAMFGAFLLQVFTRYVLNNPLGWTVEVCLATWLWVVFWSAAFLIREPQHVTFNIFYHAAPAPVRRVFALLSAGALLIAFAISLAPTWDFVSFMKIDKTPVVGLRFDYLFVIYVIFILAVIVRAAMRIFVLLSPRWREETGEIGGGGL
jgi:C4-dicarboxylate transporter DctQ subunit